MAGKGDSRRPSAVPQSTIDDNWSRTFGRRTNTTPASPPSSDTSPAMLAGAGTTPPSILTGTPTALAVDTIAKEMGRFVAQRLVKGRV